MNLGTPCGFHGRGRAVIAAALILVGLASLSCSRAAAPPPPPPAEAAPAPPPPAPAITLSANPAALTEGDSTTLEWSAQNANAVQIEPGIGTVDATGTRSVTPNSSVTYPATATGPGGSATDTVRVTVNPAPTPAAAPPPPDTTATVEELFRENVQPVYFDYDSAEIRPDQVGPLQSSARFLEQNPEVEFTVSGHADERGSQEYNLGLGDRRANAVLTFLVEQGVPASRIQTVSYGEERPVCSESTEACWQRNRRADFMIR